MRDFRLISRFTITELKADFFPTSCLQPGISTRSRKFAHFECRAAKGYPALEGTLLASVETRG